VKFDKFGYWMDFSKTFPYEGFLKDVTISVDGMKKFLEKHMQSFDALADEHISRFNSI
jgi:hypothetical protein